MDKITVLDFNLYETMHSGQFFLFDEDNNIFSIVHRNSIFKVKQVGNSLYYENISEENLINFFTLEEDISFLKEEEDKFLVESIEKYYGLRNINQDLWQCIIGFVCSSAANIPKIKLNLKLLCENFGKKVEIGGEIYYLFPEPGTIDDLDVINSCKAGYRSKYIYEINRFIKENPNFLEDLKGLNYDDSKENLMKLPGIGSKVADCICLFGLGHRDSFPIDTWVIQAIERHYLKRKAKNIGEVKEFVNSYFGENKGIKQQYLFHHIRNL